MLQVFCPFLMWRLLRPMLMYKKKFVVRQKASSETKVSQHTCVLIQCGPSSQFVFELVSRDPTPANPPPPLSLSLSHSPFWRSLLANDKLFLVLTHNKQWPDLSMLMVQWNGNYTRNQQIKASPWTIDLIIRVPPNLVSKQTNSTETCGVHRKNMGKM